MNNGPNLMGERFTIPDIILTHIGGWARVAKFDIPDGILRDYFDAKLSALHIFQHKPLIFYLL